MIRDLTLPFDLRFTWEMQSENMCFIKLSGKARQAPKAAVCLCKAEMCKDQSQLYVKFVFSSVPSEIEANGFSFSEDFLF